MQVRKNTYFDIFYAVTWSLSILSGICNRKGSITECFTDTILTLKRLSDSKEDHGD